MQVMCRRLRPLVATRVRVPTPLASMLASHGIPVEMPYQPGEHEHDRPAARSTITGINPPLREQLPLKPAKGKRKAALEVFIPIRSATDILALDASRGEWVLDARQRRLLPRIQSNIGSVCVCFALLATAVVNVLTMPLLLDTAVFTHSRAHTVLLAADDSSIASGIHQIPPVGSFISVNSPFQSSSGYDRNASSLSLCLQGIYSHGIICSVTA